MYVRLKHALSGLALESLRTPARRVSARWLLAYCDLAGTAARLDGDRFDVALGTIAKRARRHGTAGPRALQWVLNSGLLERRDGTISLPPGFRPHFAYMNRQVHRLAAALRTLAAGPRARGDRAAIRRAAALFNAGLFFECHEFLEAIWRAAPPEQRGFYHGLILIAAAFYHHEKGNLHGTRIKLTQGIKYLEPYLPVAHGVQLDRWMNALAPFRSRVESGQGTGVLNPSDIPRIPVR